MFESREFAEDRRPSSLSLRDCLVMSLLPALLLAGCPSSRPVDPAVDAGAADTGVSAAAEIVVTPHATSIAEPSGATTIDVVLTQAPTSEVVIAVAVTDATEAASSVTALTFSPSNWSVPKSVQIVAVDDAFADGTQSWSVILGVAASSDPEFDGVDPPDVAMTTRDDEVAALVVSAQQGNLCDTLGTSATFEVTLAAKPESQVVIPTSSSSTLVTVSPANLTFDANTWNVPHVVTLASTGANVYANTGITWMIGTPTVGAPVFLALSPTTVDGTVCDLGGPAVDVHAVGGGPIAVPLETDESGWPATFEVVLRAMPTADVVVSMTVSHPLDVGTDKATLTFTASDWSMPQIVTVTGIDDGISDGTTSPTLTLAATSADLAYANAPDVVVDLQVRPPRVLASLDGTNVTFSSCNSTSGTQAACGGGGALFDGDATTAMTMIKATPLDCTTTCPTVAPPVAVIDLGAVYEGVILTLTCSAYMGVTTADQATPNVFATDGVSVPIAEPLVNGVPVFISAPVRYLRLEAKGSYPSAGTPIGFYSAVANCTAAEVLISAP